MEKPKKIILANATKEEHIEMMKSVVDQLPIGACDVCGAKEVKVFPLTNCDDPTQEKNVCFGCMTGEGIEVLVQGKPELN